MEGVAAFSSWTTRSKECHNADFSVTVGRAGVGVGVSGQSPGVKEVVRGSLPASSAGRGDEVGDKVSDDMVGEVMTKSRCRQEKDTGGGTDFSEPYIHETGANLG